ncbi:hypothetical protein SAMCCGM7_Ch0610 [Sinorhizobium americanum CCGM7]|nr:hypothetical protein SAMCCGM7_Ch0610 [Sinorhizobium americanum CCGM7]
MGHSPGKYFAGNDLGHCQHFLRTARPDAAFALERRVRSGIHFAHDEQRHITEETIGDAAASTSLLKTRLDNS